MALVVFLRGINVGGHRRFRPSTLAAAMKRFDVVSIGAAGTLVVRGAISRTALRAELARRLPFDADVMICDAREIVDLTSRDRFSGQRRSTGHVQFVSVLARKPVRSPRLPASIPSMGRWCVRILGRRGRFVLGVHRREMKAIGCLGQLERIFGSTATTRSWSTMVAVRRALEAD
jgi:uncharacterized protein (DUF1697 family)